MLSAATTAGLVVERGSDFTAFWVGDQFVGHCAPSWDGTVFPARIAGWFAFDERPQPDGRTAANLGCYRRREVAEAVVQQALGTDR